MSSTVLLVEDDDELRRSTAQALSLADLEVLPFASSEEALGRIGYGLNGMVISDIRMAGLDGLSLMARIQEIDGEIPVVLVTGHGDIALAVRAMREGAYDFVEKPFSGQALADIARRALDRRALVIENRSLRAAVGNRDAVETRLPGRSPVMVNLRHRLRAVASSDADVLIVGETGTGKEIAARALHDLSPRREGPFVAINCAALPATLIESELFGHEIGAFPGAMRTRYGKFEHARGGTILLDEIGAMPTELQTRLLRVVEERVITRLGSNETIPLDVRFVAIGKTDLEDEVAAGRFRADLLYRLNTVMLRIPALSARRDDIGLLFTLLAGEAAVRYRRDAPRIDHRFLDQLARQDWPGNVRELRNAADRFVLGIHEAGLESEPSDQPGSLGERVAAFEKQLIAEAIRESNGVLRPVYETLGISRKTLYEKMQRHGLGKAIPSES